MMRLALADSGRLVWSAAVAAATSSQRGQAPRTLRCESKTRTAAKSLLSNSQGSKRRVPEVSYFGLFDSWNALERGIAKVSLLKALQKTCPYGETPIKVSHSDCLFPNVELRTNRGHIYIYIYIPPGVCFLFGLRTLRELEHVLRGFAHVRAGGREAGAAVQALL